MPTQIKHSKLKLFTDDSLLYKLIKNPEDTRKLQVDLDNLTKWAGTWQMKFNESKCETACIAKDKIKINYQINNVPMKQVESFKYLGITIASALSFEPH
jgi:hypothetical protein